MSLLTKEQHEAIEEIRAARTSDGCDFEKYEDIEGTEDFERLFAIIDDIQARAHRETAELDKELPQEMLGVRFDAKLSDAWDSELDSYELSCYFAERARRAESRAQKQYTDQELRESFEQSHLARVIGVFDRFEENGMYKNPMIQARFDGWKSCARHVGALKAEP